MLTGHPQSYILTRNASQRSELITDCWPSAYTWYLVSRESKTKLRMDLRGRLSFKEHTEEEEFIKG